MSPPAVHAAVEIFGDVKRVRHIPVSNVVARLDEIFEQPVVRAASLPGYPEYETSLAVDGWPDAAEPLALHKVPDPAGGKDRWQIVSGVHVLAAAKKLCKERVPCFFLNKNEIAKWQRAITGRSLQAPAPSADDDEAMIRAYYRDDA